MKIKERRLVSVKESENQQCKMKTRKDNNRLINENKTTIEIKRAWHQID